MKLAQADTGKHATYVQCDLSSVGKTMGALAQCNQENALASDY